jgi:pyruvate/2-oxoglutarate/acetoin dehydrogenase E1 component
LFPSVIFLEPKKIYRSFKEEVPEDEYTIPLGKANVIKEGKDIDYVGATALELVGSGESSGSFAEILIDNQKTNKVGYR